MPQAVPWIVGGLATAGANELFIQKPARDEAKKQREEDKAQQDALIAKAEQRRKDQEAIDIETKMNATKRAAQKAGAMSAGGYGGTLLTGFNNPASPTLNPPQGKTLLGQ